MTRALYRLSLFIIKYWWVLGFGVFVLVTAVRNFLMTDLGKNVWQKVLLKTPLFGPLICTVLVARFCRILGVMLNAGVSLLQALAILKEVIDSTVFARIVQDVYSSVERGEGISKSLVKQPEFPKDVVYMISVGEMSSNIETMLNKSADFYERKAEMSIKVLLIYIEPVFICVLGAVVGCILASVLLPMFDMVKTIQH